jgi:hypothetical protein
VATTLLWLATLWLGKMWLGTKHPLQPFASPAVCVPMAESGGNSRRIGRKSGMGSTELLAGAPAIRPEIGVFDFIFTNRRSSSAEYRLMETGRRRDGKVQATGRRIGEGWCRRRQSNDGRERGICVQIVGFARSLADRAGTFPLFSRPESPSAPWGTGVGLDSPDGFRPKSGGKRGTGGATGPNTAVRM